jgi:hypothetical protein
MWNPNCKPSHPTLQSISFASTFSLLPQPRPGNLSNLTPARHHPQAKLMPAVSHLGCTEGDAAYFANCVICLCFPPIMVFWRKQMRDMYSIKVSHFACSALKVPRQECTFSAPWPCCCDGPQFFHNDETFALTRGAPNDIHTTLSN